MDGSHFDTLTKSVAGLASRRQALGGVLIASLALLSRALPEETAAHEAKKQCRKKSGDAKKKCLKKAKKHNRRHATETTTPPGGTTVPPPPPLTCPAACPENCNWCVNLADGSTRCTNSQACEETGKTCASSADCTNPTWPHCATSYVEKSGEIKQLCGVPPGTGTCYNIGACA